jgi:hypothetical protein
MIGRAFSSIRAKVLARGRSRRHAMFGSRRSVAGAALVATILVTNGAWAQNLHYMYSARIRMPECRAFLSLTARNDKLVGEQCAAIVSELILTAKVFCMPKKATLRDAVRIVVRYVDARPARQSENFILLAREGLREAWPCRN